MTNPKRIQRKRTKDWRMPDNCVYVGRPSMWGNPFPPDKTVCIPMTLYGVDLDDIPIRLTLQQSLEVYRSYAEVKAEENPTWLNLLRGKDLACWCALDEPCHADILLEIANR